MSSLSKIKYSVFVLIILVLFIVGCTKPQNIPQEPETSPAFSSISSEGGELVSVSGGNVTPTGIAPMGGECEWRDDEEWCCDDDGYVICGNTNTCGPTQDWCNNFLNGDKSCSGSICCNTAGHIIDYSNTQYCCPPDFPFLAYGNSYGEYRCWQLPYRSDNNGASPSNYYTRGQPCNYVYASPSGNYAKIVQEGCDSRQFWVCEDEGMQTNWLTNKQYQGEIIGKCGVTDPCSGVVCLDKCQGNMVLTAGHCSGGNCVYDTTYNCPTEDYCEGAVWKTNPRCELKDGTPQCITDDTDCLEEYPESCVDKTRHYNARCEEGCKEDVAECDHLCANVGAMTISTMSSTECRYNGESCGDSICRLEIGEDIDNCPADCHECIAEQTQNCTTDKGKEGKQSCDYPKWGECKQNFNPIFLYSGGGIIVIMLLLIIFRKHIFGEM